MITAEQKAHAQRQAAELFRASGIAFTPDEASRIEVADFGLGKLDSEGAQILTMVQTERIGAKVIALTPGQTLPEHWHPPTGDDPGKEETVRMQWGTLYFCTAGPDTLKEAAIPESKEGVYTLRNERVMKPGDQLYCRPGEKHWFQAGPEGAVLFSFSSVARDVLDQFTDPEVRRVTQVKEY